MSGVQASTSAHQTQAPQILTGRVTAYGHGFFTVLCDDAPKQLQTLFLRVWQMGQAGIGDKVELRYELRHGCGLWTVHEVRR